ncbi:aldo/keto reductase [Streptomyces sp. DSM 40750]
MRTTTLGTKGPQVGVVGLGCMGMSFSYDQATPRDEAEMVSVIHQALDLGMTLLDTSDVYGP